MSLYNGALVRMWLNVLYVNTPGLVHVSAHGNWAGQAFADYDAAAAYIAEQDAAGREGIYLRATTLKGNLKAGGRGSETDSLALPGLWADIDIAGPGHKTTEALPPDDAAARAVITASGLPEPSLWVHSGGGLYPWWLLDKAYDITSDNLPALKAMSSKWQTVITRAAKTLGWHYGSGVGDLARVLRVPGTVNRKEGLERPCSIIEVSDRRYTFDELRAGLAVALEQHPDPEAPTRALQIVRNDGELTPGDDFEAKTDWSDALLLGGAGWKWAYEHGGTQYWIRPGKTTPGTSATTGRSGDRDRLFVFSEDAQPFESWKPYNKFGAYALLHHGGDHSAAAKELRRLGYGSQDELSPSQRELIADLIPTPRVDGSSALAPQPVEAEAAQAEPTPEEKAAAARALRLLAEVHELRIRREARRQVDAEEHAATWREPASRYTLIDELAIPDEPVRYLVDDVVPSGANVLLTAQFKAGKTTMSSNLVRSLVDGDPFLGKFDVHKPAGRVAIFNYEVDERQYRRWLRDIDIANPDRVSVLNLRGYRLPIIHPHVEDWIVRWLADHEVSVWIVDPFARAFVGCGDEVSNSDVGVFLDTLDVIKERAGVSELILPTHTGRAEMALGAERARGATRLDDWADVRWILTVDEQQRRFFRATGRDVEVDEELISFDPETRHLRMGGWDRKGMRRKDLIDAVVCYVRDNPGLGTNEIIEGLNKSRTGVSKALQEAIKYGQVYVKEVENRKRLHFVEDVTAVLAGGRS